jgi:glycolate oxidase FAD binding subunit
LPDAIQQFSDQIRAAAAGRTPLRIRGGGTKDFYGVRLDGETLDTRAYSGIVDYEPTELVLTARAGTPLADVEAALAGGGQMLAFEPPHFGADATFGGCIAAGLSGPRRAAAGSVRDFVLGVRMLNGAAEDLRFGGQVMKNVAGYDISRLLAGSFGTLGLLLEVSVKVLPRPELERTLRLDMPEQQAIEQINRWAGEPLPLSASCIVDGALYLRLSGAAPAVEAARRRLGGEAVEDAGFWRSIRDQTHPFFSAAGPLWRLSIRSTVGPLKLGPTLIEWNGNLRWIAAPLGARKAHEIAQKSGGHATLFRGGDKGAGIQQLTPGLLALHKRLKQALDPQGIFGPGRIHPEF